jgi:hypothetical protein
LVETVPVEHEQSQVVIIKVEAVPQLAIAPEFLRTERVGILDLDAGEGGLLHKPAIRDEWDSTFSVYLRVHCTDCS